MLTTESLEGGVRLDEQVDLAGLSGRQENTLARQLNIGQRVLVTMKRSEFDLEPRQCTGIVKYVGKIDSEYIDNRVYVGVKLDEPSEYIQCHVYCIMHNPARGNRTQDSYIHN